MKAMLFAAGLGTRLQPLTDKIPKALAVVAGQTLLERAIFHLAEQGVNYFVINVHHHANQIIEFLQNHGSFGLDIYISDETNELLETGGGLLKAANHFSGNEPFVVINADVICNIDIVKMMDAHKTTNSLASLAVRNRPQSSRQLLFDEDGQLCGRINRNKNERQISIEYPIFEEKAFSGIHILSPKWFELTTHKGKFSIIDSYLELCKNNTIQAYAHDEDFWFDVGSIEKLSEAEGYLSNK
jgi:MurNAc alpha-1-phosphate uridylyltransferase